MKKNQSGSDDSGIVTNTKETKSSATKTRSFKSKSKSMPSKETDIKPPNGKISLGFEADRILGATLKNGRIVFRIKRKDSHHWEEVRAIVANQSCPELVISFYEAHLILEGECLYTNED